MKRTALIALALVLSACTTAPDEDASHATPATDLGLAPGDLSANPIPGSYSVVESDAVLARPYQGSPPLIPHEIDMFLPITREDNFCLDCHMIEEPAEEDISAIPRSHYTDLRNAPGEIGETITGARWNCTSCHIVQTDAAPLVNSLFHGGSDGK